MANYKYSGSTLGTSYLPKIKSPLDVRTVVNDKSTITLSEAYVGMLVFDTVDSNLYVCTAITSRPASITWKAISSSSKDELAEISKNNYDNPIFMMMKGWLVKRPCWWKKGY